MIQDRGNIKWRGMMLTEHTDMLRAWKEANEHVPKPKLDEYEKTDIANEIFRSHVSGETIKLSYWRDGTIKSDYGVVIQINNQNKFVIIDDSLGPRIYQFDEIVSVIFVE